MYHFGGFHSSMILPLLPAPACAASAALMDRQPSFPLARAPSWRDREAPRVLSGKLITVASIIIKILKVALFGFSTACLFAENSFGLHERWQAEAVLNWIPV